MRRLKSRTSKINGSVRTIHKRRGGCSIERIDDLQCRGYRIIQNTDGFCFGMDAVLLANYAKTAVTAETSLCDLCTGNGIIPLLLAAKTPCRRIVGIELQETAADMAVRSVKLNHEENRIQVINGDIKRIAEMKLDGQFQMVTANPPYMDSGLRNPNSAKELARHEAACSFDDVAAAAARILRSNGRFFLVHRPNRLVDLMNVLRSRKLEPKRLRFVQTYADKEPNLLLMEAVKGGGKQIRVEAPLVIYERPGVYTAETQQIYQG